MSAIGPLWGERHGRGLMTARSGQFDPRDEVERPQPERFRTRVVDVLAMGHDGSADRAEAIAAWVAAAGAGDTASLDVVAGRVVVLVLQPAQPDVLWLVPGQHLVLNRRHGPRWSVYGAAEFGAFFAAQARELPIFPDGEVA